MESMTGSQDKLDLLSRALVEDIVAASDESIVAEAKQDGLEPNQVAASIDALFAKAVAAKGKARLAAARSAVAADRSHALRTAPFDAAVARQRLSRLFIRHPDTAAKLTMAARKEKVGDLSDDEVRGLLEDFEDLGILPSDEQDA
jgi:hypothetical protein